VNRTQGVTHTRPATDYTTDSRNGDNGSVEDIRMETGATKNIHNADPLEDVAAKIQALARFPVSEAEMDRIRQTRRGKVISIGLLIKFMTS